jgi:hypothetical protein
VRDEESGNEEQIDPSEVVALVEEHHDLIQFLTDWENGLFTMSKADYESIPATLVEARRIFQSAKREARANKGS